ncbi:hypothetical protein SSPS47_19315 [Streptomyces sp. S4.7]|uniref:hypothetical protein n=1 Tax=Streptomyces sp. S4.7 TaxID=2705439 RepID=UPI001398F925|nr:hypothetical protein [Streptomyces sp. S4.7]QHY97260.1 hypothetical protein SSPS47_19315 [Streptomyces sp. S4.7]
MNENGSLTFDGLAVPLRVLRLLHADFGHLPTPTVDLSGIYPGRLTLRLHEGLGDFETWREALAIPPESVTHSVHSGGHTRSLTASIAYGGADVHLHGYSDASGPDGGALA